MNHTIKTFINYATLKKEDIIPIIFRLDLDMLLLNATDIGDILLDTEICKDNMHLVGSLNRRKEKYESHLIKMENEKDKYLLICNYITIVDDTGMCIYNKKLDLDEKSMSILLDLKYDINYERDEEDDVEHEREEEDDEEYEC